MKTKIMKYIGIGMFLAVFALGLKAYLCFIPAREMYERNISDEIITTKIETIQKNPNYTTLDKLPNIYKSALLSAEDKRFYSHNGFDLLATCRALFNDIRTMSFKEGGSTITQQIAKNEFFTQEKQISRKIAEVMAAWDLERLYTKDELLEVYINSIYYGNGYYGVYDAAQGYFGKTPDKLTDAECVMFVGIPNAPSAYAPTANPKLTLKREKIVIKKMIENKAITKEYGDYLLSISDRILSD